MGVRTSLRALVALVASGVALAPRAALACGASAGSGIGAGSCSLDEHAWEVAPKLRAGVALALTATRLHFSHDLAVDARREVALATLELRGSPRTTWQLGVGALAGGWLDDGATRFDLRPGLAASVGVVHRFVDARGAQPFVLGGAQASVVATSTRAPGGDARAYDAFDIRLTAAAGWTLAKWASVYGLGRVFGGPIAWSYGGESVSGTDAYHYQLGAGVALALGKVDVGVEGVPLGERGASVIAGVAF